MVELVICILISIIANECNGFPFDTMFFYITLTMKLCKGSFRLLKKYKQKIFRNTNDENDTKVRQINPI